MIENNIVKLEDRWPQVVGDSKEFKQIAISQNPEFNLLWQKLQYLEKELFITLASDIGLVIWEKLFEIDSKGLTVEQRRALILIRLNEEIPYTDRTFRQMLNILLGKNNYDFSLDYNNYLFNLSFPITKIFFVKEVVKLVQRVKPCNLIFRLGVEDRFKVYTASATLSGEQASVLPYMIRELDINKQFKIASIYTGYEIVELRPYKFLRLDSGLKMDMGNRFDTTLTI